MMVNTTATPPVTTMQSITALPRAVRAVTQITDIKTIERLAESLKMYRSALYQRMMWVLVPVLIFLASVPARAQDIPYFT